MKNIKPKSTMEHIISEDFEFFHYRDEGPRYFQYKNHDAYEIYFLISGNVTYLVEGKAYSLQAGDVLLINSSELHKPVLEEGKTYERIIIWVKPDFLTRHSNDNCNLSMCFDMAFNERHNLIRLNTEMLRNMKNAIMLLEAACSSSEFGSHILKNAYLMEIIVYLNRYFTKVWENKVEIDTGGSEKINDLLKYINANLTGDLSLSALSSKFYTNKYHLLHEFKKYTGYSIHQYTKQKRLILAKSLLKEGKPVVDVCEECGFGDYTNFIRAFKNAFGISPGKYCKK